MTKQEFEARYGKEVSERMFDTINDLYMEAGDNIDKDTFVKDYKKHEESLLLQAFYDRVKALEQQLAGLGKAKEEAERQLDELHDAAAKDKAQFAKKVVEAIYASTYSVYDVVEEEFGLPFIIKTKHAADLEFNDVELDYMVNNLK